ncbi:hypothetical protein BDN72DRAFT_771950 [Pluteus cervinus]|uniref:Uncharacterized protein n=1 Tax=Pluteus cervinus TaxID=181527 RepID=A0ACD3ALN9_9AGAR|nr:hypothetical protein BDN72DRAFT_771950 [Pluteus cervinus]
MAHHNQPSTPLRKVYLASFAWNWCWAVIAGAVGLNALIKFNNDKHRFSAQVPPPTVVNININDVFASGMVATILSTIIAIIISNLFTLFLFFKSWRFLSRPAVLRGQAFTLLFLDIGLFAAMVPFSYFFATRSANVTAFLGQQELPPRLVQQAEALLGITTVYHKTGYLRLLAVFPWINFLFTLVTVTILFAAASKRAKNDGEAVRSEGATVEKASRG